MRVRILPSSPDGSRLRQHLISFLVDGEVAIDAGCLGLRAGEDGTEPHDVFLTHSHLDHVATLPLYIEDRNDRGIEPIRIYGSQDTLDDFRRHFFNERIWVDDALLRDARRPWVELRPIERETPVSVNGFRVTPVPVHHTVPTFGYLVDDGESVVVFGADSGPTERIWELGLATGRLRAVFLECSFPDSFESLAERTGHLTPRLLERETRKLPADVTVIAVHLKPRFRERIVEELKRIPRATIGQLDQDYAL